MTKYVNENGICYVKAESVRHLVYGPVAKCLQQQADEIEELRKANQHLWSWIPFGLKKQYTDDYPPYAKIIKGIEVGDE